MPPGWQWRSTGNTSLRNSHVFDDEDSLTAAVVASKPTPVKDLLLVASYNIELALSMARSRKCQFNSALVERLGTL